MLGWPARWCRICTSRLVRVTSVGLSRALLITLTATW